MAPPGYGGRSPAPVSDYMTVGPVVAASSAGCDGQAALDEVSSYRSIGRHRRCRRRRSAERWTARADRRTTRGCTARRPPSSSTAFDGDVMNVRDPARSPMDGSSARGVRRCSGSTAVARLRAVACHGTDRPVGVRSDSTAVASAGFVRAAPFASSSMRRRPRRRVRPAIVARVRRHARSPAGVDEARAAASSSATSRRVRSDASSNARSSVSQRRSRRRASTEPSGRSA